MRHANALPIYTEIAPEVDSIKANRSLLDDTDHVAPLLTTTANGLRTALTEQANAHQSSYKSGLEN